MEILVGFDYIIPRIVLKFSIYKHIKSTQLMNYHW